MHSPIKLPGMDLTLTPVPSLVARMWVVTDKAGRKLGRVHRHRENPGTNRERTRWGARTNDGQTPPRPLTTRRAAVEFLIEKEGTQ